MHLLLPGSSIFKFPTVWEHTYCVPGVGSRDTSRPRGMGSPGPFKAQGGGLRPLPCIKNSALGDEVHDEVHGASESIGVGGPSTETRATLSWQYLRRLRHTLWPLALKSTSKSPRSLTLLPQQHKKLHSTPVSSSHGQLTGYNSCASKSVHH